MVLLNGKQTAGWGHPAYKYLASRPVGPVTSPGGPLVGWVTPPGGTSVKYPG
jgi:hypothetical protein